MKIDNEEFTIYYSPECPYVEYEVNELSEYAKEKNIKITFIKIDSLEKAKEVPCIFNNWANFYKGKFLSNTILNANSFEKIFDNKKKNFFRSKKTRGSKVTRLEKNRQRKRLKIKLFSLLIFQILKFTTKYKKYGKTIEKSIFFRYNNSNQK